jgi:hypothetical protein
VTRWAIDYRTKPNTPLTDVFDTGQPRSSAHSAGVTDGLIYNDGTTGALVLPGYVTPGAIYEFADTALLDGVVAEEVDSVEVTFDFWNALGTKTGAVVALGMFAAATPGTSPAHMVVRDDGTWALQAVVNGAIVPLDEGAWPAVFNAEQTVKVVRDRKTGTATLTIPGVPQPAVVTHPLIAGPGRAGFWELVVSDPDQHAPRILAVEAFSAPIPGAAVRPSQVLCSPWATTGNLTDDQLARADTATWTQALVAASEVLYALGGRRYRGTGCRAEFVYDADPGRCCAWWTRRARCSHGWYSRLRLPDGSARVEQVVVDGEPLDAGLWQQSGGWLWRVGGHGWPPHGGRVVVTYGYGVNPPQAGVDAAVALAEQFVLATTDPGACELPQRVTSVSRQGVDVTLLDPQEFLTDGRTGLYSVDLFLAAENPGGRARVPSAVWSPQIAARGRRTPLGS